LARIDINWRKRKTSGLDGGHYGLFNRRSLAKEVVVPENFRRFENALDCLYRRTINAAHGVMSLE
jgi:hypothetical protein